MKMIDCHMHYVKDTCAIKKTVETSKWKSIYLGYKEIRFDRLDITDHMDKCQGGFVMPYCFKETNVLEANTELVELYQKRKNDNYFFLPFISDSIPEIVEDKGIIGLKEHFYIHDSFRYFERIKSYQYLSDHRKILILHCDNSIRIDYVKYLIEQFPNIIIQVAHMGIFRKSIDASRLVINELADYNNVYFDISAVFDPEIIQYAYLMVTDRILFGTDVPYLQVDDYLDKYEKLLLDCRFNIEEMENIYHNNAEELVNKALF